MASKATPVYSEGVCAQCDRGGCICPERNIDGSWDPSKAAPKKEEGLKYDKEKSRVDLIPPQFIEEIGDVLAYGAAKYEEHDWRKGLKWMRIYGSTIRHLLAWARGEDIDKESSLRHLAHAATNILFLMEYTVTHKELDNRYEITKKTS